MKTAAIELAAAQQPSGPKARARSLARSVLLALIIFAILYPLRLYFVPNDNAGYVQMMESVEGGSANVLEEKGKLAVAWFYYLVSLVVAVPVFTNGVLFGLILLIVHHRRSMLTLALTLFCIFPLAPYFGYVTKECLLIFIFLLGIGVSRLRPALGRICLYGGLIVFSIFIRQYYLPMIILAFVYAKFDRGKIYVVVLVLLGVAIMVAAPRIAGMVYDAKRAMWERLKYDSVVNTLFDLKFSSDSSFFGVISIALQNFWAIVSAFFFKPNIRLLFALFHLLGVIMLARIALRCGDKFLAFFGVSVILFMAFLVPDSGTFVRHCSAMAAILGMSLGFNLNLRRRLLGATGSPNRGRLS